MSFLMRSQFKCRTLLRTWKGGTGRKERHGFWNLGLQVSARQTVSAEGAAVTERSKESGKSLGELMVVVAIIGVMAAMAVPSYQGMTTRVQARNAVAEIASMLRLARQLAMARRERLLVRFDLSGKTVTLRPADTEGLIEIYRYGDKGIALDEPTAGHDLFFHPSGRSASATTIVIHDRQDRRTTVTVSLTGRVVIS